MSQNRTDVHSPTNLNTEDYEFVSCGDHNLPSKGLQYVIANLVREGWHFDDVHNSGQCSHCGAHLRYYAILQHTPSHTLIHVGETCLDNRFSLASAEFHKLRKAAELDRQQQRIVKAREEWLAGAADRQAAWDFAQQVEDSDEWAARFIGGIKRYGSASDKFVAAMLRSKDRYEARKAQQAINASQEAAESVTEVLEGVVEITGEVLSVKIHESDFGSRLVMTVKDDRGFKVWGTVPESLQGYKVQNPGGDFQTGDVRRGDRVTFTANITKSDRDDSFGFFKRPRKATIIELNQEG